MSKEIAEMFRRMADRIEKNGDEPFGGAALIVSPGPDAYKVELLKLDPTPDAALFWGEVKSRADEAAALLSQAARQNQAFRR